MAVPLLVNDKPRLVGLPVPSPVTVTWSASTISRGVVVLVGAVNEEPDWSASAELMVMVLTPLEPGLGLMVSGMFR